MERPLFRLAVAACLFSLLAGCSGASRAGTRAEDRNVLDVTQIDVNIHPNALAVIQAMRPHWLQVRSRGTAKRVYLDDMHLGGLDMLRAISAQTLDTIEYYDGPAATQRWGPAASAGVILLRSRNR